MKLKQLFFAFLLCAPLTAVAQDIEINAENFPDENFRSYLISKDYGEDGVLTEAEIKGVTYLNVSDKDISNLKGIEYFTALTELRCENNRLTTLDVSKNTALEYLYCQSNQLTSLSLSQNLALVVLYCNSNKLTTLDISGCTSLEQLECSYNELTSLSVSGCTALRVLSCHYNGMTSLDISKCSALVSISCRMNQLKGKAMDSLVSNLPQNVTEYEYILTVLYNPLNENEGNVCTKSQVAAIKAKGWTPHYYNGTEWTEYEGSDDESANITQPELQNGTAPICNLAGQRVTTPQKGGIYIVGGKKVVVK